LATIDLQAFVSTAPKTKATPSGSGFRPLPFLKTQQLGMPAGRTAEVEELVDVPEPADPAVLPAEPDGVEPAVLLLPVVPVAFGLVVVVMPEADLSLTVLVLTSQHLLASAVEPVPLL
jgi:hypothetical protein